MEKEYKCPECGYPLELIPDCGMKCDFCGFAVGVDVE